MCVWSRQLAGLVVARAGVWECPVVVASVFGVAIVGCGPLADNVLRLG